MEDPKMNEIKKVHVENMTGSSNREVPNQFIIRTQEGIYFQSYQSLIVFIDNEDNVFLDKVYWDYSRTTGKYRNKFLDEPKAETAMKIRKGVYKLVDLNEG